MTLLRTIFLSLVTFVCLAFLSLPIATAGEKLLTIDQLYGGPPLIGSVPMGAKWRPDNKLITFLKKAEGDSLTSLWACDANSGKQFKLIAAEELTLDDGGRVGFFGYQWFPDNERMLLKHGGDFFLYNLDKKDLRRLLDTDQAEENLTISPQGDWLSYVRDFNLFALNVKSGTEVQLTADGKEHLMNGQSDWVYCEEFELCKPFWWSPDDEHIAFIQFDERRVPVYPLVDLMPYHPEVNWEKYPKAGDLNSLVRVGVVSLETKRIVWMNVGEEDDQYIPRVTWLSDGEHLAIQVLNRDQNELKLLIANIKTGESRILLREQEKTWINVTDDFYFFKNSKQLLWSSERDGWRHFYLYDLSGNLVRQLTSGEWTVTQLIGVDEKRNKVYFMATENTPLERHLYRVNLDASGFKRLTQDGFSHMIVMSPDRKQFLDYFSNIESASRVTLNDVAGKHTWEFANSDVSRLEEYALGTVEFVDIKSKDGATLYAYILKPPAFDENQQYPVIVNPYGGPHGQVVRNSFHAVSLWSQMMAERGYIIFKLDNRGSPVRGKKWEDAIFREFGENELADQLSGVEYLKSLPYVDPERIGIWGWSYGGYMTLYAMLNAPEVFKVGVAVAPVTDWRDYDTIYTERYMDQPIDNVDGYRKSSPVFKAANLKGKLLIIHGTGDDNVHIQNSVHIIDEFIKQGKQFDLMIYPGKKHGIQGKAARKHLFTKITYYFLDNL